MQSIATKNDLPKLVTVGIPIYKRLEYLSHVLQIVAAQDYRNIELLVSDNGMNGSKVADIVEKHYPKPYTFRQNASTVSGSIHFNQVIQEAKGEYVVILADDDEISPNFVSELVQVLEKHPEVSAALAMEEVIDLGGKVLRRSKDTVPQIVSGPDFIRTTFKTHEYGFESLSTFLARTDRLRALGGFPDIWCGTCDEDLLMVKLALDGSIACSTKCAFRKRQYETSFGYAIELSDLLRGIREFLRQLHSDPKVLQYSALHPAEWNELSGYLVRNAWAIYHVRWRGMYKERMRTRKWVAAGFALPLRNYYRIIASALFRAALAGTLNQVKRFCPQAYTLYRSVKYGKDSTVHTA